MGEIILSNHNSIQKRETINNKGFSIVELIIAVTILGIASIPLMRAFSASARTNAKAQKIQNATSFAESVMEEVKASSLSQLMGNTSYTHVSGDKDSGTIIFTKTDEGSGEYTATVTLDAKDKYSEATDVIRDEKMAEIANSIELPQLRLLDQSKCAVISTEINKYDGSAIYTLIDKYKDEKGTNTGTDPSSLKKTTKIKYEALTKKVSCAVEYEARFDDLASSVTLTEIIYFKTFNEVPAMYILFQCLKESNPLIPSTVAVEEAVSFTGTGSNTYLIFGSKGIDSKYVAAGDNVEYKITDADKETITISGSSFEKYINGSESFMDAIADDYIYEISIVVKDSSGKEKIKLESTKTTESKL